MLIIYTYILRVRSGSCSVSEVGSRHVMFGSSLVSKDESVFVSKVGFGFFTVRSGSGPRFGFLYVVLDLDSKT